MSDDIEITIDADPAKLQRLTFAAQQAGLSLSEFLLDCADQRAAKVISQAEKRVEHLATSTLTPDYQPTNWHSPWLRALGSGSGLYASPTQVLHSAQYRARKAR